MRSLSLGETRTMKISDQWVKTDWKTNKSYLYTKYENGMIKGEPITVTEAAQWMAEKGF